MAMAAPIPMRTDPPTERPDPGLLLAQLFSPAFPTGAFAWSHGVETAIARGLIADAAGLRLWLEDLLAHGSGRNDALLLAAAHGAAGPEDLARIDETARALSPSAERLAETVETGTALARTASAVWDIEVPPLAAPLAAGRIARLLDLPAEAAARHYLLTFASNLVSAALRLMPLGQTEGQRLLAALAPLCARIAAETADGDLDALGGAAYLSDVAAMRHEDQTVRIFRS